MVCQFPLLDSRQVWLWSSGPYDAWSLHAAQESRHCWKTVFYKTTCLGVDPTFKQHAMCFVYGLSLSYTAQCVGFSYQRAGLTSWHRKNLYAIRKLCLLKFSSVIQSQSYSLNFYWVFTIPKVWSRYFRYDSEQNRQSSEAFVPSGETGNSSRLKTKLLYSHLMGCVYQ